MNSSNTAGLFIDKIFIPILVVISLCLSLSRFLNQPLDIVNLLKGTIVPVITLTFLVLSKPPQISKLNFLSILGIIFSFGGFYLFDGATYKPPDSLIIFSLATTLFYLGISVWSYLSLGRKLSIIPALRGVVANGPYRLVRHPIYACYIHLALSYTILFPSFTNITAALIIFIGLFLRAREEESLLIKDATYFLYCERNPNKFFSFLFSFPLIILAIMTVVIRAIPMGKRTVDQSSVIVQFAHPATSLNPLTYDDWGSVFIGNHIYRRFLPEKSRPEVTAIARNLILSCKDGNGLNSQCPVLRLTFSIIPFSDCENREYSIPDIKAEFFQILNKKSWILPNMKKCEVPLSDVCVELPNAPDIKRRLRNLYMRFGWSKSTKMDKRIGVGPYCLSIQSQKGEEILGGELRSKSSETLPQIIHFHTSADVNQNFNIALYGTSELLVGHRVNIMAHTPLGYYVVTNPKIKGYKVPWNMESAKVIIKSHFIRFNLISPADNAIGELLPKGAASSPERIEYDKSEPPFILALPDYIPQCNILSEQLNRHWRSMRLRSRADCINTSYFVEQVMKDRSKKWSGFLTPLSPGAPGRNAIHYQYFSPNSKEAWTGSERESERFYYLVGVGQSFVTVDNSTVCGLKPNSMGHGDIFIADFLDCGN